MQTFLTITREIREKKGKTNGKKKKWGKGRKKKKFCPLSMVKKTPKTKGRGVTLKKVKQNYKLISRTPFTGLPDLLAPLCGTESCRVLNLCKWEEGETYLKKKIDKIK